MTTLIAILIAVPWLLAGWAILISIKLKIKVDILESRIEQQEELTMKIIESIIDEE